MTSVQGHAGPRDPNPPPGLTEDAELNDSIWELYRPNGKHDMEIIFFHGLQLTDFEDAFWKTWVSTKNDQIVWPKDWLSKKFPNARILSVSYNSSATQSTGQSDMFILGENLVGNIILDSDHDIGQHCPVFLVGHCLGGIVIKHFILHAILDRSGMNPDEDKNRIKRISTFLENFKGAFFYGTPHSGSDEIPKFIASQLQSTSHTSNTSPILRVLTTLDTETGRINEQFRQQRRNWNARTFAVEEFLPTISGRYNGVIVTEASARHDIDRFYSNTRADHFTVCKARNERDSAVIGKLTQFIVDALPEQTVTHVAEASMDMT